MAVLLGGSLLLTVTGLLGPEAFGVQLVCVTVKLRKVLEDLGG